MTNEMNLSKSEQIAYNWLVSKGYTGIKHQTRISPDFTTSSGELFEVKRILNTKRFDITFAQFRDFDKLNPKIIAIKNDEVVDVFEWKDYEKKGYSIYKECGFESISNERETRFVSKIQTMHRISIPPKVMKKLNLKEKDSIIMTIEKDGIKLRKWIIGGNLKCARNAT